MSNHYYIEKIKPVTVTEHGEAPDLTLDTLTWIQADDQSFDTVTQARQYIDAHMDKRLSYRITDGGKVFSV